jgi:AbrB family looped-hinge helix DNA binding protein
MKPVRISRNYRVTIPREIREQFGLKPGQEIIFIPYKNTLRVIVVSSIEKARGMLKGIDTEGFREEIDEER